MNNWVQPYDPLHSLPLSAAAAALPFIALIYILGIRRGRGHHAALAGLSLALWTGIGGWGMPVGLALQAALQGVAFTIFPIFWIIVPAVWLYRMHCEAGEFSLLRNSLIVLTADRRLQAVLIAFAFGAMLEGIAGFGVPVAITTSMLLGLGFPAIRAVEICLLANVPPVVFGALGIPMVVAANVSGVPILDISNAVSRQVSLLACITPLWLTVVLAGWRETLVVWPAWLTAGIVYAAVQYWVVGLAGPFVADLFSSLACIISLVVLYRIWQPKTLWRCPEEGLARLPADHDYTWKEMVRAWSPYVLLGFMLILWGSEALKVRNFLVEYEAKLGFNTVQWLSLSVGKGDPLAEAGMVYTVPFVFNLLSSPGTAIFLVGMLTAKFMPGYGLTQAMGCLWQTMKQLRYAMLTVSMILAMSFVINYSGMGYTLGLAFTATGSSAAFLSPVLGWLGVFLTGSDSSANALFALMQRITAEQLGLPGALLVSASAVGGATGKMVSPQSLAVALAATGLIGREGELFRKLIRHSAAMCLLIALLVFVQANSK